MSVVNFPSQKPQIWICDCGCSSFTLRADGEAECCNCELVADGVGGGWMERIRNGPSRDPEADPPYADVQGNGSEEFARRRLQRLASQDDVVALAVVKEDGRVSSWSVAETDEQIAWTQRLYGVAAELIGKKS